MSRTWIAVLVLILYIAVVILVFGFLVHVPGGPVLLCALLSLLGIAAFLLFLWYQKKYLQPAGLPEAGKTESAFLDAILRDADQKLRQANRPGARSAASMPLIYILGDENSAKTQTVLQSGLEPELIAGQLYRDRDLVPTQAVNIWLAGSSLIVEAGGALLRQPGLWIRLLRLTQPSNVGAAFSSGSRLPTRAAVVCVSIERILAPNTAEQIRALALMLNERLRQLSQTLGISLPVYVLITKIDAIPSFADYASRLTPDEVRSPLGSILAPLGIGAGLYAERATEQVGSRFDELVYSLSEFRLEVLSRGGEADALARAYEFPRDLRKIRAALVEFLVELARPSQLGVNPFLRGFFFTGMRAHFIEDVAGVTAAPQAPAPARDPSATSVYTFATPQAARQPAQPARPNIRKVPQWVFLPHLFANILLADKSALESSRASTKVSSVKRILLAIACLLLFTYAVLLAFSYANNSALEHRVAAASQAPAPLVTRGNLPALTDLQSLDQLRQVLVQLQTYRKSGAPLMYHWGLYQGDALEAKACQAYAQHFQRLLLSPVQANILTQLRALPANYPVGAVYGDAYQPLRAYLITTSHPEKSSPELPAVLNQELNGSQTPSTEVTALVLNQFNFYAAQLPLPGSCLAAIGGAEDDAAVAQARLYLNQAQGSEPIYQSILAAGNAKFPPIVFNDKFFGSEKFISDHYRVTGAFTKAAYSFMTDAARHPERYSGGEQWVLGPQSGPPLDLKSLPPLLLQKYTSDYIKAWRAYLTAAAFHGYTGWPDADDKLNALFSNVSPMLELFSLISWNTAVDSPDIAKAFQAPQAVVSPASANGILIGSANQPYIQGLQGLEQAAKPLAQAPQSNDPALATAVNQAANTADLAAGNLRSNFVPDPDGHMDATSFNLLDAPIKSARALAGSGGKNALNGAGQAFCAQIGPVLNKFPFNPGSTIDATPEEAAGIFQPGVGLLSKLPDPLSKAVVLQGGQFIAAQGSPAPINPSFLKFLNAAQRVSTTLYSSGTAQASLDFSLTLVEDTTNPPSRLDIDGTLISSGEKTKSFHWKSQPGGVVTLTSPLTTPIPGGPWSVFHFARFALPSSQNQLVFHYDVNGQNKQVLQYNVGGNGAPLLNPGFMAQLHCVSQVAR
jgi:type VI secretion system protein ImpL